MLIVIIWELEVLTIKWSFWNMKYASAFNLGPSYITVKYDLIAGLWEHEGDYNTVWKFWFRAKFCIFLFCLGNAIEVVYRCGTLLKIKRHN